MAGSLSDLSRYRFEKAKEQIQVARNLLEDGSYSVSLNRSYYAIFHAIRAVNALDDFDSSKHSGVIAHFNQYHVKTGEFDRETSKIIRFVGGGALSKTTCQILADITGRTIETVPNPQNAGSVGAAMLACVGLGLVPGLDEASEMVSADGVYYPREEYRAVYDRNYKVFHSLYESNRKNFAILNG